MVVDSTKVVPVLGKFPLPVEVVKMALPLVERRLEDLGLRPKLRRHPDGSVYMTDEDNFILDCACGEIPEPEETAAEIRGIVGVVEHGLFLGMASMVLVAGADGVTELVRGAWKGKSFDAKGAKRGATFRNVERGAVASWGRGGRLIGYETTASKKVWLVTGASTGFGRELVEYLLSNGAQVVATARKVEGLQELRTRYPKTALVAAMDVTDQKQVDAGGRGGGEVFWAGLMCW